MPSLPHALSPDSGSGVRRSPAELRAAWQSLLETEPKLRIRDAAERLGVSELELLALNCGETATRLSANWGELIQSLPRLGPVMALTRNDHAVHEKRGQYGNISIAGPMGLVLDEAVDLRLFLNHWHSGFAVTERSHGVERRSLQFFDRHGGAVHKVYLTDASYPGPYESLVERYAAADQSPWQETAAKPARVSDRPDADVDRAGLLKDWRQLRDTHDFHSMLKRWKAGRLQALRLADRDLAFPVSTASAEHILTLAARENMPIMVFVGSPGTIQIHSGTVRNIKRTGPWINVLDDGFNLHLRDGRAASSWVVRKPTEDGVVTSLELFEGQGGLIVQFFGKRKPGTPESGAWRDVLDALPPSSEPGRSGLE